MARSISLPRKLAYTALVFAILLMGSELLLRLVNPEIFEFVHTARQLHRYTTWHKVDLRPSSRGQLRLTRKDGSELFGFTVNVDEQGARTHSGARSPAWDRHVVHCIGDSYTMGWGVEDDEAYPARLADLLGATHAVVNLGVDGYGLLAATEKSRRVAGDRHPDTVIYLFCDNDLHDDRITREVQARSNLGHAPWFALDGARRLSYLANIPFAIKWAATFAPARGASPNGEMVEQLSGDALVAALALWSPAEGDTATALLDLAARCDRRGTDLRFVAIDTLPVTLQFVRLCQQEGIPHLLVPMNDSDRIPGDGHLDAGGNERLALQIHRVITAAPAAAPAE